ncbi:type IV secretory system conjugative DNA transfer family protein [Candidatus Magnetaquicoccus inordinatus]|uniref:type IV secretory system conjugative DNA transfer family protein n=1 Tax=Candidatus Magnetaquicoccus inordinatus TaxID=2496818 RepID=UPI00102CFEFA|nr:type IV secretory system conjugative DNA transfer family protein [Candidatus Magnetaquicoccus inordinatus]
MSIWGVVRSKLAETGAARQAPPSAFYLGERFGFDATGQKIPTGDAVTFQGDEHILLIGPTRCGKGRSLLAPNLILHPEHSALVVDPKGELARWTGDYRAGQGHSVIHLDPFGVLKGKGGATMSHGFNPLLALNPESDEFIDDAMGVAEALVMIDGNEPHWASSAQDFVAGVVMYVVASAKANDKKPSLRHVRQFITCGSDEIAREVKAIVGQEGVHEAIPAKLEKFTEADKSKELASVISTAQTQTRFLDSPLIVNDLERGELDFAAMKTNPMTVYLVIPPYRLATHGKWLRLVIGAAIRDMQKETCPPTRPAVLFVLDEFPQLGRMESIETSMALNAGFGIKIVAVVQHLKQLEHHYKENWETFLSGGVIASFGPRDAFTSEYLSKLSGQEYVAVTSKTRSISGLSETENQQLQATFLPHQFRMMWRGELAVYLPTEQGQELWWAKVKDFSQWPEVRRFIAE